MNQLIEAKVNPVLTLKQLVDTVAGQYGESCAAIIKNHDDVRKITYGQFRLDVRNIAFSLRSRGITGKNIAIIGGLSYEWAISFLAAVYSGNVAVPIDKDLSAIDMSDQMSRADIEAVFFDRACAKKLFGLQEIAAPKTAFCFDKLEGFEFIGSFLADKTAPGPEPEALPDAAAVLIFTSGTTGASKIVKLTNRNVCDDTFCCFLLLRDAIKPKDINIPVLPPHHMFCLTANILTGLYFGVSFGFGGGIKSIAADFKYFQPQSLIAVPMIASGMYKRIWTEAKKSGKEKLLKRAIKVSNILRKLKIDLRKFLFRDILEYFGGNLKTIVSGGAFLEPELVIKYDELGIKLRNGYGITECSPVVACNTNKLNKPGSVGLIAPSPYCKTKIIDGEICISGSIVMSEYYKDPVSTKDAFISGYYKTGDLGYIDEDNCLYITGRKKNLIILADGNNISPEDLEIHLEKIPLIKSVIVCAKKGAGNMVLAAKIFLDSDYIVKHDIHDAKEIINAELKKINVSLPPYKRIQQVEIVETDFQKTALGKIKRYLYS
ncbi:MAG: AMP-binding protein [Clostridiales bacterium]|jgi:long-chain acyl-CoA synthetase|nr:AMP-binding protein [Clostridiales bacterium]